jgi:tRNA pseudouridine55 synthase
MKKRGQPVHGWVVFDKPLGMTSTQAVGKIRRLFDAEKAGHGGTLDPLATGLLPIALGEATKTVQWAMDGRKIYRFEVTWGAERTTDDMEGAITAQSESRPAEQDIESILNDFQGVIQQAPPAFSAIKIDGGRAYDLARAGEIVDMAERPVTIKKLVLAGCPDVDHAIFEVTCGKGTYVRSLARDMGRKLGCLGHVSMLRRIAVGPFSEVDMIPLETIEEMSHKPLGNSAENGVLRPLETVLDGIPALALKDAEAQRLKQGQSILLRGANAPVARDAVLVNWDSKPLGICSIEQGSLKPKRLFNL